MTSTSLPSGWSSATLQGHGQSMQRVDRTNEVRFPGMDFSNGSRPLLIVVETQNIVVVKIPGGKHFAQIGHQASHAAQYIVFAKLPSGRVMEIVPIPVRTSNIITQSSEVK